MNRSTAERRYALARLGATLESVPELTDRLNLLGERFEVIRSTSPTEAQQQAAAAFDQLYGDAAMMLSGAEGSAVTPSELLALEEAIRRVEDALETYAGLAVDATPNRERKSKAAIVFGMVLLGGVVYWARTRN